MPGRTGSPWSSPRRTPRPTAAGSCSTARSSRRSAGVGRVDGQRRPRPQVRLAQPDELVVPLASHQLDELRAVRDVHRLRPDVRLRVAAAVPVEVVSARAPATAFVLPEAHLGVRRAVGPLHVAEGTPDGQLPADVGLGLEGVPALAEGQAVEGAALAALEAGPVEEDARALVDGGLAVTVLVGLDPPALPACVVELPVLGLEHLHEPLDPLLVVLVGEVRAERAAAVLGPVGVDARASLAEDAHPARGQPRQVTAEDLAVVGGVLELDPGTWEDGIYLWHGPTLRPV